MSELEQKTLKAICELTGDISDTIFANIYLIEKEIGELNADIWLLGWLCSKETLLAVWGEEMMCNTCGGYKCLYHADEEPAFKYHGGNFIGKSLEEVLSYYSRYLEGKHE